MLAAWIWCATIVLVCVIAGVTGLIICHNDTRIYREHGYLMEPEWDSWLEKHKLARKTR